ncbi:MAG: hypothetical protein MI919_14300, partial [Holophagales bacterium]|nr:hypothetical protein [Holophagales bacterium]
GEWRGERVSLDGTAETAVLFLEVDEDGKLVGTLSFPDRDDAQPLRLEPMSIHLEVLDGKAVGSDDVFEGFIEDKRTTIRGFWYYNGEDRPMNLHRVGADGELVAKPARRRPPRAVAETGPTPRPAGRWHGQIQRPGEDSIEIFVDLDRVATGRDLDASSAWAGELDMQLQEVKNYPLDGVSVEGESEGAVVRFVATGLRDDPVFEGRMNAVGSVIEGTFAAGAIRFPFRLERIGEAEMEPRPEDLQDPPRFAEAWAEAWAGRWQGTLRLPGHPETPVFLNLEVTDRSELVGTIDVPDLRRNGMPIVKIVFDWEHIRVELPYSEIELGGFLAEDGKTLRAIWSSKGASQHVLLQKVDASAEPGRTE